jgi:predicted GIY-YIG superfamily endonuclease
VFQESHQNEQKAVALERQRKRWTHIKKFALINGDVASLKAPVKRLTP